jgi:hypothetical protein
MPIIRQGLILPSLGRGRSALIPLQQPSFKLSLEHSDKRAPRRKGFFVEAKDKPDFYIFDDGGGNAQLEAGCGQSRTPT